jgi:predicted GNAT family N-acyltransferase
MAMDVTAVHKAISHLSSIYPDFDRWYWSKVVPEAAYGTRHIDTVVRDGALVAVAISKKNEIERKLCTIWVDPAARGAGHGPRLIGRACAWLGTETPYATVSEEHIEELRPIIERMGWRETGQVMSLYRPGRTEFLFNQQDGTT